jgi:glucose/mannose-6-phosphate isomerase
MVVSKNYICAVTQTIASIMKEHVETFIQKLVDGISIGEKANLTPYNKEIKNILIAGLGGSGIGGTVVAQILEQELKVPVIVCKDYFLPAFVNESTLLIISSYSGNTEETVQVLTSALSLKPKIVCVTAGGKVLEIAKQNNLDHIIIPNGMPPRSCFAYSFTQLFYVLKGMNLISNAFEKQLQNTLVLLNAETENIKTEAKLLAQKLLGKLPVIYSTANYEGVCVRFRQQINENSKMLCWHAALPEMNHNEIVGWVEKNENLAVVFFRNEDDFYRTQKRMDFLSDVAKNCTPYVYNVWSKGASQLERTFYLVLFGDWVSVYLGELKNIDASEVKVIDRLKQALSNM